MASPNVNLEDLQKENAKLKKELEEIRKSSQPADKSKGDDGSLTHTKLSKDEALTVIVFGASGDLAKKKTFPALFALYTLGLLPENIQIIGYARSKIEPDEYLKKISANFKGDDKKKEEFLKLNTYHSGGYDDVDSLKELDGHIKEFEEKSKNKKGNRIFYLAIPPSVFSAVSASIKKASWSETGWNRVIIEKPFGLDYESSEKLSKEMAKLFSEEEIYRIDHYLGKEMVQNLMALRFANSVFEPLWNRNHIKNVQIVFKENFGTQGRGGYFDEFGIIRDVMQNHLTQVFSLLAMEAPISLDSIDVAAEKTKLLRCVPPIKIEETVIGQYTKSADGKEEGYLDDKGVPKDSVTPTFCTSVLYVNNTRWRGVPFIMKCGKALNDKKAEVRIQFHPAGNAIYPNSAPNELVLRLSDEAIYMKLEIKKPGLSDELQSTELDLTYKSRHNIRLPDAYERLIYDVIRGDHNLFVRSDELAAAWKVFTPLLDELDSKKVKPIPYAFGSRGPKESDDLVQKFGYVRNEGYVWTPSKI